MIEGDRFEVLDITTSPTSEYVGLRFRDMPIRGALIGAIVRDGAGRLPAQRRRPPGGRPRDRLHRVVPRRGRRARPVTAVSRREPSPHRAARIGDARLGSSSRGALGLIGTLLKYLSVSALFPTAAAHRVRRAVLAVPRRRRHRGAARARPRAARAPLARPDRVPGGLSRRVAHVAPRGRYAARSRTSSPATPSSSRPSTRSSRRCPGSRPRGPRC